MVKSKSSSRYGRGPSEILLDGPVPNTMARVAAMNEVDANETLATFRPVGLSGLGDRRRSAGVPERNLDRRLEALLLSYGRPYLRQRFGLPRGALGCDCGRCALSPCSGLARCLGACCAEPADTAIRARCMNSEPLRPVRPARGRARQPGWINPYNRCRRDTRRLPGSGRTQPERQGLDSLLQHDRRSRSQANPTVAGEARGRPIPN